MKLLGLFTTISFTKMKENYFSDDDDEPFCERQYFSDDYDESFCERQYTHGSYLLVFFLFKFKFFDQFNPPEPPQILDIYSVVVL